MKKFLEVFIIFDGGIVGGTFAFLYHDHDCSIFLAITAGTLLGALLAYIISLMLK